MLDAFDNKFVQQAGLVEFFDERLGLKPLVQGA